MPGHGVTLIYPSFGSQVNRQATNYVNAHTYSISLSCDKTLMSYAKTMFTTSATLQVSKLDSADSDHGTMAQSAMQEPYLLTLQIIWKT